MLRMLQRLSAAARPLAQVALSIELQPGATPAAASLALEWAWPHGRKQLRSRTATATPPAATTTTTTTLGAASAGRGDDAVAAAESWFPSHAAGAVGAGAAGAGPVEAGAMVLLDDGVEVSPAFYLLLKRFLLVTQVRAGVLGVRVRVRAGFLLVTQVARLLTPRPGAEARSHTCLLTHGPPSRPPAPPLPASRGGRHPPAPPPPTLKWRPGLTLRVLPRPPQSVESGAASPAEEAGAALASRAGLLGVALGRPAASAGGEREAQRGATWRAGRRAEPSECGAMYLAAPWLELHEHVTDHLDDVLLKGAEGEAAQPADVSWAAMQRGFMEARDYSMLYLGVTLCRRQGDANTTLATEAEVEALLARDWSQLIASAAGD